MRAAFFDFDGTLLTQESGRICAIPAMRSGLIGLPVGARVVAGYLASKLGVLSRTAAQRIGFETYRGRTLAELRMEMQRLHDRYLRPRLSPPVLAAARAHRTAGDAVVIATASAFFFAEPLARELGSELIGTQLEWDTAGRCTGRVAGDILEGAAKARAARAWSAGRGLRLEDAAFYTDHIADLPFLELVREPVAVGPSRRLRAEALRRGWKIISH